MKEVKIDNSAKWQLRHWRSVSSSYNRSPYFEYYRGELETIYSRRATWLVDWNHTCFQWAADKMSIPVPATLSEEIVTPAGIEPYEDWRNRLRPATINRLYPATQPYPQVFEDRFGFLPNLSILDKLFCDGNKL